MENIRNFVIIAHVDHGKSTLADRFLELTGTVEKRKMHEQYLDMHPLERERGITIKMQPVRMIWRPNHAQILNSKSEILNKSKTQNINIQNNSLGFRVSHLGFANSTQQFVLNLIDTPGHADFSYEVSRALAAVEGAILLVDATQGVQAQTLVNLHLALRRGLVIIPAVNKVDLPSAETEKAVEEIRQLVGCPAEEVHRISAKEGTGAEELLEAVVKKIPPPQDAASALRALIFDSKYDPYLGVIAHIRVVDGALRKGDRIHFMAVGAASEALEVGVFSPERTPTGALAAGEIGYVATGVKEPHLVRVGDTLTSADIRGFHADQRGQSRRKSASGPRESAILPLAGYREPAPVVFASLFPENQDDYENLREALEKLRLEDAALTFAPEDAGAETGRPASRGRLASGLGRGFRAGFLGLLHMEIAAERIKQEYDIALVLTRPSVALLYQTKSGTKKTAYAASQLPDTREIARIEEPWARMEMITPPEYLGALTALITASHGAITRTETLAGRRLTVECEAPLREIISDFYDRLKSVSQGFASFSYDVIGYRTGDLARLDILIAGEPQPALSEVVLRLEAYEIGRQRIAALKELLPRQLFAVAVQAAVEGRILARETIPALKKDVTGYLYGGDRTRKMKLWKKQQRGKKRLKETGRVEIPPEIFFKLHRQFRFR